MDPSKIQRFLLMVAMAIVMGFGTFYFVGRGPDKSSRSSSSVESPVEPIEPAPKMQALLDDIRKQYIEEDRLFGQSQLRESRKMLLALPANASPLERISSLSTLGNVELTLGETRDAVQHLEQAFDELLKIQDRVTPQSMRTALRDLSVAHIRLGEIENCLDCCTSGSCIFPIRGDGVHKIQTGSRRAILDLTTLLKDDPNDLASRWLLNIAHMTLGEYPDKVSPEFLILFDTSTNSSSFPSFKNVALDRGVATRSLSGGVVLDDFDGDRLIDIVTSDWHVAGLLRYFRNTGKGKFVEETVNRGFRGLYGGLNINQADYDNDGDIDLFVMRGAWRGESGKHPNSLLQNDGNGNFIDVSFESGIAEPFYPTSSSAWSDCDLDGDLDLFVCNEDFPCQLFVNQGNGKFIDQATNAGVTNDRYTKGATWGDYNNDRYPDLYVSNYGTPQRRSDRENSVNGFFISEKGTPNRLYRNNRDGTFTDVAEQLGVTQPSLSFPTWFWDVNNDGHLDIFAASYAGSVRDVAADYLNLPHNAEVDRLYLGKEDGTFQEVATAWGITRPSLAMGANFGDLDNDGWDDFYLGTGAPEYEALTPNFMYHNREGTSFEDVTEEGRFGHLQKGHAIAFADLDNDGDQDLYSVLGGAFGGDIAPNAMFENPGSKNHSLTIYLRGVESNRMGIGCRVKVTTGGDQPRSIYKWTNSGGSFGSNTLRREIGLGASSAPVIVEVFWPKSNRTDRFENIPVDCAIEITEGNSSLVNLGPHEPSSPSK